MVAGVMGSVDAEVDDTTVDIVLESAWFQPGNVRATSRKLGLHSDSSQRFSRTSIRKAWAMRASGRFRLFWNLPEENSYRNASRWVHPPRRTFD